MWASDFNYDGIRLSEFGFMICYFDGSTGLEEVEAGTPLNFHTVSTRKGNRFALVDLSYDNALEVTFDIVRDTCVTADPGRFITEDEIMYTDALETLDLNGITVDDETINLDVYVDAGYTPLEMEITDLEYLSLVRWLVRKQFLPMRFIDDRTNINRYYRGAFTRIARLEIGSRLYGLRLTFTTDRPYALGESVSATHDMTAGGHWDFSDPSYLTGTIIPDLTITLGESGILRLNNNFTGTSMVITGCTAGETITVKGDTLQMFSDVAGHNVWASFNYDFFKVGNSMSSRLNTITSSLACTLTLAYQPIIRDAP